jgi:hypothetical protein
MEQITEVFMKDAGVGFPPQKNNRAWIFLVLIFWQAFFLLTACTDEKPGKPMAPKVVVRMKAPPMPQPKADEPMDAASVSASHDQAASPGPQISDSEPGPATFHERENASQAAISPDNASGKDDSAIAATEPADESGAVKAPEPADEPIQPKNKPKDGLYMVKTGDTLASISAREDIYGDVLKWPCLYRINMDQLDHLAVSERLPEKALPEGTVLTYVTEAQAKANIERLGDGTWVVNVLSSKRPERIVPAALQLINAGFRVYIVRAEVKGDHWMRLRVGFYEDGTRARAYGEKIAQIITTGKLWVAKVEGTELQEFGGY